MNKRQSVAALATICTGLVLATAAPALADHREDGHWARNASRANVYFRDFTGARFPVGTMINSWNTRANDSQLQLYYRSSSTGCPSGSNCVDVREMTSTTGPTECRGDGGCTRRFYYDPNYADHFRDVEIWLNTSNIPNTTHYNRVYSCHELGHSISLGHQPGVNSSNDSCMDAVPDAGTGEYPDDHDEDVLFDTYDHVS